MHKNINEIKKLESPPQVIKNLFDKNEIEKFFNLYKELPITVHNKKQNVIKKRWLKNYSEELENLFYNKVKNVIGDFNEVSIHSYYNDYMGGENMLRYASYCTNDIDVEIQEEEKIEEIEVIERQEEQRAIISFPPLGLYPPEFKILS